MLNEAHSHGREIVGALVLVQARAAGDPGVLPYFRFSTRERASLIGNLATAQVQLAREEWEHGHDGDGGPDGEFFDPCS